MGTNRVKNINREILSDRWALLEKVNYDYQLKSGEWVRQNRESYNRGDGAAILLYNPEKGTVVLTKQFRMPTYLNDNTDGFLVEACAGMLDKDHPEDCIIKEVEEETGYRIKTVKKVVEAYSSPGAVTEKMHYFIGEYSEDMKVSEGGGLEIELEDIEVKELPFSKVIEMVGNGQIQDAKTIILVQYAQIHKLL
ncbi:NUDIX domain-containing protein [Mangrovimonas xylaniphaga]|uniref:NUDIX domain-containing protein n=1 Tax=Mangrovimonas xylaniphaga TaxID=1645915 RepID=UPI0006B69B82|nr:NUDIX domain-containing protein [Mangrovimonas xylaniphaga]